MKLLVRFKACKITKTVANFCYTWEFWDSEIRTERETDKLLALAYPGFKIPTGPLQFMN